MKRLLLILVLLMAVPFSLAWGATLVQTVEISSSPNPVGSGARATGMGGAFIGVADDATAASWNPAGLIQLETPEISIVGAYNHRIEDTTYAAFPEASGPQSLSTGELNYLSFAYPFAAFNRNMIVSLNYQHLYDFNKKVNYSFLFSDPSPPSLSWNGTLDYEQKGAFKAISPAFAVQITPSISFGLTLNIWENGLYDSKWESHHHYEGPGLLGGVTPIEIEIDIDEEYIMAGKSMNLFDPLNWHNVNYNLGLMWNINSAFTLGAVFKAPFEAHLRHNYHFKSELNSIPVSSIHKSEEVQLNMPMSYGLGLAWRLSDALTLDLDVYRTEWDDYALHDGSGNKLNPITGKNADQSHTDPTTQVRFGGEYLFIGTSTVIPLRAGLFYDPEPAENSPDDFYGFSLGTGVVYKRIVYDIAYQYRFGRGVRTTTVGNEDSTQDVDQHTVYMSLIYHF
ncbi:OmpP1/FadL family transporter [Thermodesulfobacteriota bacterium]